MAHPTKMPDRITTGVEEELPPELARISQGRDHILTHEYGQAINKADQTIRKNYCLTGEAYGIRPIKVGRHLLWPVRPIAALLRGGRH